MFKGTAGRGQRPRDQQQQQQQQQRLFQVNKVPGFATQMRRESLSRAAVTAVTVSRRADSSPGGSRTRDNSPKLPRPRSEEIPLEDMRLRKTSLTSNSSSSEHGGNASAACGPVSSLSGSPVCKDPETSKRSEETSFTEKSHNHESRPRRKGQVETV